MIPLYSMLAAGFIGLLIFILFLNIPGLPANWIIVGLVFLWNLVFPENRIPSILFWCILIGLGIMGDVLENWVQILKARKYGCSSAGTLMGFIGAFAGAILLAPLFWGIGAFIGALAGAFTGCLFMEMLKGKHCREALHSAFGTMVGRFLGTICKLGAGAAMIAFTWHFIKPGEQMPISNPDEGEMLRIYNDMVECLICQA